MNLLKGMLVAGVVVFMMNNANAQGCSDAGFCSLKYGSNTKNSFAIGNVIGIGDGTTFINNTYVQFTTQVAQNTFWDTKLNTNYASGDLGSNFGIGDVITNLSFQGWKKENTSLHFVAGAKFPLSSPNAKAGSSPLPMAYQASLGTVDALLGVSVKADKWEFTQAWQIPLTAANTNAYIKPLTNNDFPSSNKLQRKNDALVRVGYNVHKGRSSFSLKPNVLAIYHLGNDKFTNTAGTVQTLIGSGGLTLNLSVMGKYSLAKNQILEFSLAAPAVVRTIRPDGLTRGFTAGIEYKVSF